jgi:hypothetical protein
MLELIQLACIYNKEIFVIVTVRYVIMSLSQCDMAVGSRVFFDMMHNPPAKAVVLGDACSHVTLPVAESAVSWNIFQVGT